MYWFCLFTKVNPPKTFRNAISKYWALKKYQILFAADRFTLERNLFAFTFPSNQCFKNYSEWNIKQTQKHTLKYPGKKERGKPYTAKFVHG